VLGTALSTLSVAGNDTWRHTTSHAMRALTMNPAQRAWLLADLDARLPGAVEEFVRWATPVLTFRRTTTREVQLHGQTLTGGRRWSSSTTRATATRGRSTGHGTDRDLHGGPVPRPLRRSRLAAG
jgi:cytochrome P450